MAKRPTKDRKSRPVPAALTSLKPTQNPERSKFRSPRLYDLYWILLTLASTAETIRRSLEDIQRKRVRILRALELCEYEEPLRSRDSQTLDRETIDRITAIREKLRLGQDSESLRNPSYPARRPSKGDHPYWGGYRTLDTYYEWRARLRAEIAEARQIIADVSDEIDSPAQGLLDRESAVIRRSIDKLEACLPGMSQVTYVFVQEPERFRATLATAVMEINRLAERLQSKATEPPPTSERSPKSATRGRGARSQGPLGTKVSIGRAAARDAAPVLAPARARGRDSTFRPPPVDPAANMSRPVRVAEIARVIPARSDVVLRTLRARGYPIGGPNRRFVAELTHVIAAYPRGKKRLMNWADEHYPAVD